MQLQIFLFHYLMLCLSPDRVLQLLFHLVTNASLCARYFRDRLVTTYRRPKYGIYWYKSKRENNASRGCHWGCIRDEKAE